MSYAAIAIRDALLASVIAWMHALAGPTLPRDAPVIADAIVAAVLMDREATPVMGSRSADLALLTKTAWDESRFATAPIPFRPEWGAQWGGAFQLTRATMPPGILEQARKALWLLHRGAESCPESPAAPYLGACKRGLGRRIGDARVSKALDLLRNAPTWESADWNPAFW